jgi:hypothetical protein
VNGNVKVNARRRAEDKLGQEGMQMLAKDFVARDFASGENEWMCDGIIISLLRLGLTQIEIKSVIPVDDSVGYRLARLQYALKDTNYVTKLR